MVVLPSRRVLPLIAAALFTCAACRDEQAGPRAKSQRPSAGSSTRVVAQAPSDLTFRSRATWAGGALQYLGARVTGPGPEGSFRINHYFRAAGPVPEGYSLFMHVVDADTGQLAANADHPLALPGGHWPRDGVVEDTVQLRVPPERTLELRLGFFRGEERLPVDDASLHDGAMRVPGPRLGAPQRPLPTYTAPRTGEPPRIDGRLDDAAWQRAPPITLTRSLDGGPVTRRTVAKLLHDDRFLYLGFECDDDDVWGTLHQRDAALYNEEVVEIFLDASADGRTYHELEVSPHNVLFDAYFPARRQGMDLGWDSGAVSAVQVRGTIDRPDDTDQGWTVELKVPLSALRDWPPGKDVAGARWRMNLYRLEHPRRRGVEGQAWSPLFVGDFHHLPRFGWLVLE